jgi:Domain of unknown function (DUF397)
VEASANADGVLVRNSSDPGGPVVHFTPQEWTAFVGGVRDGDFDFGFLPAAGISTVD